MREGTPSVYRPPPTSPPPVIANPPDQRFELINFVKDLLIKVELFIEIVGEIENYVFMLILKWK